MTQVFNKPAEKTIEGFCAGLTMTRNTKYHAEAWVDPHCRPCRCYCNTLTLLQPEQPWLASAVSVNLSRLVQPGLPQHPR